MSKQTSSLAARNAVVSAFVGVLESHETSGNVITQVCNAAAKWYKGEEISEDDRKAIVADIASSRGWKGDAIKVRSSECNIVLKNYAQLPEAVELFSKKNNGLIQWTNSLALARQLNKGVSVSAAVKAALTKGAGQSKGSTPQGRTAGALKAWYKAAKGEKKAAILKAAELLGIRLGVKVEA